MADPITIIGATAAGLQLGEAGCEALLYSIKLIRNLRKAPKRIKDLLDEVATSVARIDYVDNVILQSGSTTSQQLTTEQVVRLRAVVLSGKQAMEKLHHELEPLCSQLSVTTQPLRKIWNSLASLMKEPGIKEQIDTINRSNMEILREFGVVSLERESSLLNTSNQTLHAVQCANQASQTGFTALQTTLDAVQSAAIDTGLLIAQSQGQILATASDVNHMRVYQHKEGRILASIQDTTQTIHEQIADMRIDISSRQNSTRLELKSVIGEERVATREDIRMLRDDLLSLMTGSSQGLPKKSQDIAAHMNAADMFELECDTRQQLVNRPGALSRAAAFTNRAYDEDTSCICRERSHFSLHRRGRFAISFESQSPHDSRCEYHQSGKRSWRYAATAQLLPFVRKTVELAFGASFEAGAFSLTPSLRTYTTVKRSESPLFKLFDDFPYQCGTRITWAAGCYGSTRMTKGKGDTIEYFHFKWNIEVVRMFLENLSRKLQALFSDNIAHGFERDEGDNTMLHEVFFLVALLSASMHDLQPLIQQLVRLAISSGANISSIADHDSRPIKIWGYNTLGRHKQRTAAGLLLDSAYLEPRLDDKLLSSFDLLARWDFEEYIGDFTYWNRPANCIHALDPHDDYRNLRDLRFLKKWSQLAQTFGFSEIAIPILERSKKHLVKYLQSSELTPTGLKAQRCDPLCLAIGWPDGLKVLRDAGYAPEKALRMAILSGDLDSIEIILPHASFMSNGENWLFGYVHLHCSSLVIMQRVAQEFKRRKSTFEHIITEFLGEDEQGQKDLREMSDLIAEKSDELPDDKSFCNLTSAYDFDSHGPCFKAPSAEFLEILSREGFEEVDKPDSFGRTPLFLCRNSFHSRNYSAEWFLENGANPNFDCPDAWPNIMFYLLKGLSWRQRYAFPINDNISLYLQKIDPLSSDHCLCFCSTSGCLPWHKYWSSWKSFRHPADYEITLQNLTARLQEIIKMLGLNESQKEVCYAEICRLEIFDCLDMTHTCCSNWEGYNTASHGLMTHEDGLQIQEEESELNIHLELIMAAYKEARRRHAGIVEEFWEVWWERLEHMLPSLSGRERLYKGTAQKLEPKIAAEVDDKRARREREVLLMNGYGDIEDFADVIRLHFWEYFEPEPPHSEWSDPEWSDTDGTDSE